MSRKRKRALCFHLIGAVVGDVTANVHSDMFSEPECTVYQFLKMKLGTVPLHSKKGRYYNSVEK